MESLVMTPWVAAVKIPPLLTASQPAGPGSGYDRGCVRREVALGQAQRENNAPAPLPRGVRSLFWGCGRTKARCPECPRDW
jgi:hypothetical protein